MTDGRKLEIAMGLLRHLMRDHGITLSHDRKMEIEEAARVIGVSVDEVKEFLRPLVQELVDEQFGKGDTGGG
jgi:hypothetical protein